MRKALLLTLTMTLLLTGCARQDGERFETWRARALGSELCFDASVCAVTERGEVRYAAACTIAGGDTELTLTAPELCAGITVRCGADAGELLYDGAVMALPRCRVTGDDPIAAVPKLAEALSRGRVSALYRAGERLTAVLALDDRQSVELTLDGSDRLVAVLLTADGAELASITIDNQILKDD